MTLRPRITAVLPRRAPGLALTAVCALVSVLPGCGDVFNPAFLDVLGTEIAAPRGPDSAGHVVIAVRNDSIFDERLLQSLVDAGLDRTLLDDPFLRPRVRMLLEVTFLNGDVMQVQFEDGSSTVVHPLAPASALTDLARTEQDNLVVQCDVARVELVALPEVFVPDVFEHTRIDPGDENTPPFRVRTGVDPPHFERLERDTVDQFGTIIVLRNVDIRDAPAPAIAPNCGSVVTVTFSGTLSLPFERNSFGQDIPGVLVTDTARLAASPGRFHVIVDIR